ncbi:hypothetical protein ACHAQA_007386 [Verticillium albo-atrum]
MTRRKFNADVAEAATVSIKGISAVKLGPDDGEVDCIYTNDAFASRLALRITTGNVDDYPDHQGFHGSTECDTANSDTLDVLGSLVDFTEGKSVADSLRILSKQLERVLQPLATKQLHDQDVPMADADDDELDYEDADEGDTDIEFEDYDVEILDNTAFGLGSGPVMTGTQNQIRSNARRLEDLTKARQAGFKIGLWLDDNILSLGLRVCKLGLPEETLTAWQIKRTDFIVLLCKYDDQYHPLEVFASMQGPRKPVQFRIGKCKSYKPSTATAQLAFTKPAQEEPSTEKANDREDAFERLYVSNSLDLWMEQEFAALLKIRDNHGVSWDRAKLVFMAISKDRNIQANLDNLGCAEDDEDSEVLVSPTASPALNKDYLLEDPDIPASDGSRDRKTSPVNGNRSLPLVAIQFALRYFAKSPKYCMVCHLKTSDDFVAIKPYVCDNPLCLYQYMSLGFGPSTEHEIISQPLVVDLLITFFVASLQQNKLREYPVGLNILVPDLPHHVVNPNFPPPFASEQSQDEQPGQTSAENKKIQCTVNMKQQYMSRFQSDGTLNGDVAFLQPGDMFLLVKESDLTQMSNYNTHHCAVVSIDFATHVVNFNCFATTPSLARPHHSQAQAQGTTDSFALNDVEEAFVLFPFKHDLGDLTSAQSGVALSLIASTLPAVATMREHLMRNRSATIADCPGISKASLALLRWIVASNRSMIVQIDGAPDAADDADKSSRACEKLVGVPGQWVQFRFAQGSPEKEQRFSKAITANSRRKPAPTIFAWHGSPMGNWHSIIRQGLNFSEVVHGRSFGNGVYFSPQWEVSTSYAHQGSVVPHVEGWPRSQLRPLGVISLCEIVNKPEKFVSKSPHYVVADVDWIQCRYLLVQTSQAQDFALPKITPAVKGADYLKQDSLYKVCGPVEAYTRTGSGFTNEIQIPKAASAITRLGKHTTQSGNRSGSLSTNAIDFGDDDSGEDDCDLSRLSSEHASGPLEQTPPDEPSSSMIDGFLLDPSKTDFRPGSLAIESLPKLPAPTWAVDRGRKMLGREVKKLQQVQATTPIHELGWYVDFGKMENMFHWIIELHSFDPALPLAQDMKKMDVRSIVLEARFGRSFPLSPPFVRVIRPRFLPFASGGGGHVTAGGAMCMELLTNSGWSPAASIESVLLQVRMALCSLDPQPARLEQVSRSRFRAAADYNVEEAIEAYKRSARTHGWEIPPDLEDTARAAGMN